ncbi:MAG: DUF2779 domain-containing protein [Dehalococcoidales bacterium]|nr:DUF2779 domain-containing protein [Dehalococcoidales bacterium]
MKPPLLSKSKYLNGLQCFRYLWLLYNDPQQVPETDSVTRFRFDQGHQVGELAKKLFPDGINVPTDNFNDNITQTGELLKQNRALFEAGILSDSIYARIDILNPAGNGEWDIIEVKSATEVKDEHIQDVAFQRFCCEKQGLKIRKCYIAYINNKYVRHGEIDPAQIFIMEDVTEAVSRTADGIEDRIAEMFRVISAAECPAVLVGSQCGAPYPCPVTLCQQSLPENTILNLYRAGKKKYEFLHKGVLFIKDIPEDFKLTKAQQIQKSCDVSCQPHIDKAFIANFLNTLQPPLYYLDFETFSTALPLFEGTRPYQQIPFQFSVHLETSDHTLPVFEGIRHYQQAPFQFSVQVTVEEKMKLVHYSFLADGAEDPRPHLLAHLKNVLGDSGSIVVYNQSFEKRVLAESGEAFPVYREWVESVSDRIVDLYEPFRKFDYYSPLQQGSASIKEVLPAVTGRSYKGMPVAGGEDASLAYLRLAYGDIDAGERDQLRSDLEKYCGLDTEGMIWIINKLKELQ